MRWVRQPLLDGPGTSNVTLENSHASGLGPVCVTAGNQKVNTGYVTDLQGALMLVAGAHDNTIINDTFNIPASAPIPSIGSGGNGLYLNACAGLVPQPFNPVEAAAGTNNTFTNVCYSTPANYPGLPPSAKNCPGASPSQPILLRPGRARSTRQPAPHTQCRDAPCHEAAGICCAGIIAWAGRLPCPLCG